MLTMSLAAVLRLAVIDSALQHWQQRPPSSMRMTPRGSGSARERSAACTRVRTSQIPLTPGPRRTGCRRQNAPAAVPQPWRTPMTRSRSGEWCRSSGALSSGSGAALVARFVSVGF